MTLTRRHLNRATLERQLLLRRAPLSTIEALTHLAGLQAQEAQSWYVGLWSRLAAYDPSETSRLLGEASIVRVGLMRNTIHLVTADDARWLRPLLDPVIERSTMGVFRRGVTGVDRDELVTAARAILAERPMQFAELGRALEKHDLPDAPRPDPDTPAPVRFLYDFDNLLLSHDDRSRVVAVDYNAQGFGYDAPEQPRSLLVDGFVAATWKPTGDRLTIRPFRRLTATEREEVEAESAALLAFLAPGRAHDLVIDKPSA